MKKLLPFALTVLLASCGGKTETASPEKRDITQAVYASGKLFPKNDYKVSARLPGYVEEIFVNVGDTVKAGQPLLRIRSEINTINVEAAKNQFALASRNASENGPVLSALKQDMMALQSKYELDSVNFRRYENLLAQKSTSQMQYDQAKVLLDNSRAAYRRSQMNYTSTKDRLRTESENARLQLDAQNSNLGDYTIAAAVNGKVYDIVPNIGDLVNSQMVLVEIGSANEFEVELSIDETDVSFVQTGQNVIYEIDAFKDVELKGTVQEIYPRISAGNKTARVTATIELKPEMNIYSGMSVESNIIVSQKKNALVIPREYIKPGNLVKVKGKEEPVKITSGVSDLEFVEVLSGITESDQLEK
ncbi:MAG: efflux RND transporter periplasmic adaptor subunit [Bacteroidia bacterium]|nr:efflux RND transporter periplasmic adaptor subunit [Bacteroidia bacterium]